EVRRLAATVYGLEGELKPLISERDQNFRITTAKGEKFVFKIANRDEDPGVIDLQVQGLLHVERTDPGMVVPRIRRTRDGVRFGWPEGPGGARHILRAVSWIDGEELRRQTLTPALLRSSGAAVGRLARALRGFYHPCARHPLLWDATQIAGLRPH